MAKLSIVIVTYNSSKHIFDCLESITKHNDIGDDLEVIVVDNDSSEQNTMFEEIRSKYGDRIILKNSGENGGYGKGNNFGIAQTNSNIVIVMNPDVRYISPVFKQICEEFRDKNIGMAGVNFVDGSCPYYFKPEHNTLFRSLFIHQYLKKQFYNSRTMYMSGSLLVFNKSSFIKAGMFDENIFMYYEEPDITNRIQKEGKEVKWLKDIWVLHLAHGRKYNETLTQIRFTSFEYYCRKYGVSALAGFRRSKIILTIKKIVSLILRDKDRYDFFNKSLISINSKIKSLKLNLC